MAEWIGTLQDFHFSSPLEINWTFEWLLCVYVSIYECCESRPAAWPTANWQRGISSISGDDCEDDDNGEGVFQQAFGARTWLLRYGLLSAVERCGGEVKIMPRRRRNTHCCRDHKMEGLCFILFFTLRASFEHLALLARRNNNNNCQRK